MIAGASLSRQGLAEHFLGRAQSDLMTNPAAALKEADRSLSFDSDAVSTYYVKAAALARFDDAGGTQEVLDQALRHEPDNFVTWTLLGEVAAREDRLSAAKADYRRAHMLDPLDPSLIALAANPNATQPPPAR